MTIPRPRLTVRRLMIVVALAGLALSGDLTLRRRAQFARERAAYHQNMFLEVLLPGPTEEVSEAERDKHLRMAKYHLACQSRWMRAATDPWFPFEADPPTPE